MTANVTLKTTYCYAEPYLYILEFRHGTQENKRTIHKFVPACPNSVPDNCSQLQLFIPLYVRLVCADGV